MFGELVGWAARLFEAAGIAAMLVGAVLAGSRLALLAKTVPGRERYRRFRNELGAAILAGLELLVAADIIRTVAEAPSLRQVVVLGLIVLIRTFLSFALEIELEGTLPWKRGEGGQPPAR